MKTKSFLLGTLTLCIGLGLFTACDNNQKKNNPSETPKTPTKLEMKAPQVEANESGFIFLEQFPETDPHLTVKVSDDFNTATIMYDGKEIQTVNEELGLASDEATVRFLDANFDGLTDIYIGPGQSRTANSLLVWNEKEQQFKNVVGSTLQNPMLDPATKSFIQGGSNSASEFCISRGLFKNDKLVMEELLSIVTDPDSDVEHTYTLTNPEGKILYTMETADGMPEIWQKIVSTYGF